MIYEHSIQLETLQDRPRRHERSEQFNKKRLKSSTKRDTNARNV